MDVGKMRPEQSDNQAPRQGVQPVRRTGTHVSRTAMDLKLQN